MPPLFFPSVRSTAMYLLSSEAVYIASASGVGMGGLPIIIPRMELEAERLVLVECWWWCIMRCQPGAVMERLLLLIVELGEGILRSGRKRRVLETRSSRVSVEVRSRDWDGSVGFLGSCLRPRARLVRQ